VYGVGIASRIAKNFLAKKQTDIVCKTAPVISRALLAKVLVRRSRRRFGGGLVELLSLRVDLCEETGTRAMHASVERMEKIGVAAVKGKTKKKKPSLSAR
jgi:hypothetical protein